MLSFIYKTFVAIYFVLKLIIGKGDKPNTTKKYWYGLTSDDSFKVKELPEQPVMPVHSFCHIEYPNKQYEVVRVNKNKKTVTIVEICTDTEYTISEKFFNHLFIETPCPAECKL